MDCSAERRIRKRDSSDLVDIFRLILQNERGSIFLAEELKIIRAYLEIEQLWLGDQLRVDIDVDDSASVLSIPPPSIQTLVENAV